MAKFSPLLWQKVDTVFRVEMEKEICDEAQGVDPFDEEQICSSRNMDWCICGHCREMQNEKEQVCCRNKELNHEHPFFEHHVLCEQSLELAMRNNADHLHYPFDPSNPACWRFTAYRQYCLWAWGKLGKHNRKVIPSCIVCRIRDRFPDPNGNYTGFLDVEYNL